MTECFGKIFASYIKLSFSIIGKQSSRLFIIRKANFLDGFWENHFPLCLFETHEKFDIK